ncbi:MAG TPA: type II toxin-antitoxin system RelE/ParE family toxin [Smithella sp.]|nr:type II toxin-antitoxin system RelE/ParE family toxin [Smithella sp.]
MSFKVLLTADAVRDLEELHQYIIRHDTPGRAEQVLTKIEKIFKGLSEYPERGVYPGELSVLGIREYRQVFFKPYRLIYRISGDKVYVLLIADGRRDMQSLLQRRLLEKDI